MRIEGRTALISHNGFYPWTSRKARMIAMQSLCHEPEQNIDTLQSLHVVNLHLHTFCVQTFQYPIQSQKCVEN